MTPDDMIPLSDLRPGDSVLLLGRWETVGEFPGIGQTCGDPKCLCASQEFPRHLVRFAESSKP